MAFGLWLNTTCHRQSPEMNQRWAIILAPIVSCLLCGRSVTECSGGLCTVSSVLTYVQEGCCHWLLRVIMWLDLHWGSWALCLMRTAENSPPCFACCDSALRQSVEDLWKTQCVACVYTVRSAFNVTCLCVYSRFLVSACLCAFVCIFQRVILKESESSDGKNATDVCFFLLSLNSSFVLIPSSRSNTYRTVTCSPAFPVYTSH